MMTLCFSPFCRRAPFWGIWQTYMNKQTSDSDCGVSLSIGTLIGNMEGAPSLGKMSFQGMGCTRFCRRGLSVESHWGTWGGRSFTGNCDR